MTQKPSDNIPFIPKSRHEFEDSYDYRAYKFDNLPLIKQTISSEIRQAFQEFHSVKTLLEKPHNNPTNLTNPYWQWVVRYDLSADEIGEIFSLDIYDISPLWCAERMGQSHILLEDGREILIGGEWEDGYDPQFAIYNDVMVKHPDGNIEIFAYPRHIFAPTDFHTTTLVGNTIWIIGSLGYGEDRQTTQTSVYTLNIHTYKIEKVETRNSIGWIHDHSVTLKDNQIIIKGGNIVGDGLPMRENFDDWALNLKTLIWKNLTNKNWQVFLVQRKDGELLHIDEYKTLETEKENPQSDNYQSTFEKIRQDTGKTPDLAVFSQLYVPPVDHEIDESEQDYDTFTIFINGIKIRYKTDWQYIQVYIEGILPSYKLELLQENLRHKLSKLENFACEVKDWVF